MGYFLKRNSVYTCLKLPGSRRGWNVFSIDSLRGSGRGPCLGPVFITSLSNRNQRARGKKEEPFHEDTLMIEDKDRNAPGYGGRSSPIPFTAARQVSYYKKFDAFELDDISYLKLRYLKLLPL